MNKGINIILKQNQKLLGEKGELKTVTKGFARNYLIPENIAEVATKGKIKHYMMLKSIANKKLEEKYLNAIKAQKNLEQIYKIKLRKKVSDQKNEHIFGSVTDKEIIDKIFHATGIEIEKKQLIIPSIKNIGSYKIQVNITNDIQANLILQILPDSI
uniref:50S ribosomal protein L9, chloroplastic n=1 Tax=Gelidium elegans TaxID=37200 RepID=A0A141SDQ5_GELEL|nr:ribosomal protein L9 [Gelidium elegans]AMK96423.1 ribosomal protein L9 [Gelidium elegans]